MTLVMPLLANASAAVDESLLSKGRWVKVHVDSTGVYRLPVDLLSEWGFSDPSRITVAGYGSVERAHTLDTAPSGLPVLPVMRTADAIYFFGEGDCRVIPSTTDPLSVETHYNHYSRGSYYFIGETAGSCSPDMTVSTPVEQITDHISTHTSITHRVYRDNRPARRGLASCSRDIEAGTPLQATFATDGHTGTASLLYSYMWVHDRSSAQSINVTFSDGVISSTVTPDRLFSNASASHLLYSLKQNSSATLRLADNATGVSASFINPGAFSTLALVSTTFIYTRENYATDGSRLMYFPGLSSGAVLDFNSGAALGFHAWDVSDPRTPVDLSIRNENTSGPTVHPCRHEGSTPAVVVAFDTASSVPVPEYCGEVPAQSLRSTLHDLDMLIVTTAATYQPALRLAEAHRNLQGLKVGVVTQEQVFNEFSSGALHPNGLRHLVMSLASDSTPLRYLLLFGLGSSDSTRATGGSSTEYLVTYSTEDPSEMCYETKIYSSDLYFGTLAPQISPSLARMCHDVEISVGRIPAVDTPSAETYVDKCISYLSDPFLAGSFNHAIISGGKGNSNGHIKAAEEVGGIITSLTGYPTLYRTHLPRFKVSNAAAGTSKEMQQYLQSRLGGDFRMFTYTGHSSINEISHYNHTLTLEQQTRYGSLPVVFLASCNTSPIDLPDANLGRTMILHNPGPIILVGASNEVFMNYNHDLNNAFTRMLYSSTGGERLGDVFRLAVNANKPHSDIQANNLCYNFLGDPALPRYFPSATAALTSVGNTRVTEETTAINVTPLNTVSISGAINLPDGTVDTSFTGKLLLNIFEAPHSTTTYRHDNTDTPVKLDIDEYSVFSAKVDVNQGSWSCDAVLPAQNVTGTNRITMYAVSDHGAIASGSDNRLRIIDASADTPPTGADTTPPSIRLWINDASATSDMPIGPSPELHIEITDQGTGIDMNETAIGSAPRIFLDGTGVSDASVSIRPSTAGSASGIYTFDNLSDGTHTVTVTARDLAGNSSSESITFTVMNTDKKATLRASDRIARHDITFTILHNIDGPITSSRLIVRDMEGTTVLSRSLPADTYTWDLTADDGFTVPDGTYRASVIIEATPYYTSSPEIEFTIVKKK